jgi:hypothetical protein
MKPKGNVFIFGYRSVVASARRSSHREEFDLMRNRQWKSENIDRRRVKHARKSYDPSLLRGLIIIRERSKCIVDCHSQSEAKIH